MPSNMLGITLPSSNKILRMTEEKNKSVPVKQPIDSLQKAYVREKAVLTQEEKTALAKLPLRAYAEQVGLLSARCHYGTVMDARVSQEQVTEAIKKCKSTKDQRLLTRFAAVLEQDKNKYYEELDGTIQGVVDKAEIRTLLAGPSLVWDALSKVIGL